MRGGCSVPPHPPRGGSEGALLRPPPLWSGGAVVFCPAPPCGLVVLWGCGLCLWVLKCFWCFWLCGTSGCAHGLSQGLWKFCRTTCYLASAVIRRMKLQQQKPKQTHENLLTA